MYTTSGTWCTCVDHFEQVAENKKTNAYDELIILVRVRAVVRVAMHSISKNDY